MAGLRFFLGQFSYLSLVMYLDVTETAAYAIAYDCELRRLIGLIARRRDAGIDIPTTPCAGYSDVGRYFNVDLGRE